MYISFKCTWHWYQYLLFSLRFHSNNLQNIDLSYPSKCYTWINLHHLNRQATTSLNISIVEHYLCMYRHSKQFWGDWWWHDLDLLMFTTSRWPWHTYDLYMIMTLTYIWSLHDNDLDIHMTFTWLWPWHTDDLGMHMTFTW